MDDELRVAITALQSGDDAHSQQAAAEIAHLVRREPAEGAAELWRAILEEVAAGGLRTPRLLTLLGMTREPVPECVPLCLNLLRIREDGTSVLLTDSMLGAAASVARVDPRALLPDLNAMSRAGGVAQDADREAAGVLQRLLAISSKLLEQFPDNAVTDMTRWLWYDCAAFDLMTLSDFVGLHVQQTGADNSLVGLLVDLVELVPVIADQKKYAGDVLQQSGVGDEVIEQLQTAYRAIRVAPVVEHAESLTVVDPEAPSPDHRVDEWLALFAADDEHVIEFARAGLDQIFEASPRLAWWVAVTVDALPEWRRRQDINWALIQTSVWRDEATLSVPPSVLQRWLDTPQLLNSNGTIIALDLLGRQQPHAIAQQYLHRAVAASIGGPAEIMMGGLWRALVATAPATVLAVLSRWVAFGFGQNDFVVFLVGLLTRRVKEEPALLDTLAESLVAGPEMPDNVIDVARNVLKALGEQLQENPGT
jgi:hypothetical protein